MRLRWAWLGIAVPLLIAARSSEPVDIDALLRAGNAAWERGELALAAASYEKAQRLATDPGLVAFNLATVRYHQAKGGNPQALAAAEVAYRCCLEPGDSRRAPALFGLGNCLLLRGSMGNLDSLALRAAIDRYTQCLGEPTCDEQLARDARYNQQCARLLLLQAPPPPAEAPDGGDDDPNKKDPSADDQHDPTRKPGPRDGQPDSTGQP